MFAATLQTPPREAQGYLIAFSVYLAAYLLIEHFVLIAGIPLALGASLIVWHLTLEPAPATDNAAANPRAVDRLASVTAAAFLVTLLVLMIGIAHRNRAEVVSAAAAKRWR